MAISGHSSLGEFMSAFGGKADSQSGGALRLLMTLSGNPSYLLRRGSSSLRRINIERCPRHHLIELGKARLLNYSSLRQYEAL